MAILDGKLDVTTQEGYDIACALRGPDLVGLSNLKFVLTGRLRGLVSIHPASSAVAGSLDLTDIELAQEEWKRLSKQLEGNWEIQRYAQGVIYHWAVHLEAAYKVLIGIERTKELELLFLIARALALRGDVVESLEAYADYIKEQR